MREKLNGPRAAGKGPKWTAQSLLANPFQRIDLGDGVYAWVYAFHNREPLVIPRHSVGAFEVAVQLAGEWHVDVVGRPPATHGAGDVFTVPGAVAHSYAFRGDGLQVGFALDLGQDLDSVTFKHARIEGAARETFVELAHALLRGDVSSDAVGDAIRAELDALPELPATRARREIVRHLESGLYLEHLAEAAGLHPKTLQRRFEHEIGLTPIRLRTELRLQRAVRLLWSKPGLSVEGAANAVGIESPRFLHRLAMSTFGLTPSQLARRV